MAYQKRNTYGRTHFRNDAHRAEFKADVLEVLNGDYTLKTGEEVKGQSFSHLIQHLRNYCHSGRRWRLPGRFYDQVERLEEVGLKVQRGRGRRIYHGGKYGLGVECDVVTQ